MWLIVTKDMDGHIFNIHIETSNGQHLLLEHLKARFQNTPNIKVEAILWLNPDPQD